MSRRDDLRPKISNAKIDRYRAAKRRLETTAWSTISDLLQDVDYSNITSARKQVIAIMNSVLGDTTDASAVLAANFYDACREASGLGKTGALAINRRDPMATDGAVRGMIQSVIDNDGDTTAFENELKNRVGYEIRKSSSQCLYQNGKRDSKKTLYEWTTRGTDPCELCSELADVGAVSYNSDMEHYHANCKCEPVPVWTL